MNTISISEIQRNLHKLDDFDIIEVVDKKRNKVKGFFVDNRYRKFIIEMINKEQKKENNFFDTLKHRHIKINKNIDIDKLMNEMNNGLS